MNNNNFAYRIFAFTMALVMFATTVNLTIDMHFCQGQFKSMSFFGKAKTCHEAVAPNMANCPSHQIMMANSKGTSIERKGCCDNKSIQIQSDNNQLEFKSNFAVNQELQQFLAAFIQVFFQNVDTVKSTPTYVFYKSPKLIKDTYVLFESFLL